MRPLGLPLLAAGSLLAVLATPLQAQTKPAVTRDSAPVVPPVVPRSMTPPAGKCRVWIAGVPAKQQPAPTDCATALRQNPSNGTVVYGPPAKGDGDPRFELPARSRSEAGPGAFRRASLTERKDSLRDSNLEPAVPRTPTAKDALPPKAEPAKKPVEPEKKKPEQP